MNLVGDSELCTSLHELQNPLIFCICCNCTYFKALLQALERILALSGNRAGMQNSVITWGTAAISEVPVSSTFTKRQEHN